METSSRPACRRLPELDPLARRPYPVVNFRVMPMRIDSIRTPYMPSSTLDVCRFAVERAVGARRISI
jgi:hypothetical protein